MIGFPEFKGVTLILSGGHLNQHLLTDLMLYPMP